MYGQDPRHLPTISQLSLTQPLPSLAPRQPIKKLPASLDLPSDVTVVDIKKTISKATGISDFNRIGIFDPVTKKTLKDPNSRIRDNADVMKHKQILIKDLGKSDPSSLSCQEGC
jgi:very-long-chain enoyl-CoA reductase